MPELDLGYFLAISIMNGSKWPNDVANISEALSNVIIDSIVLATASVSGTFSSSITLMPGVFFNVAAATACDWFQPKSSRGPT
jgi:hypothetical protein